MKRCKVLFTGMSGEIYTDVIDGDVQSVEKYVSHQMFLGSIIVSKDSEHESFDKDRTWKLTSQAVESICIEEFEEEE